MTVGELKQLLKDGITKKPVEMKSQAGKAFTAFLTVDKAAKKVVYKFE